MKRSILNIKTIVILFLTATAVYGQTKEKDIYHNGWIDFNKNNIKDVFEDPLKPIEDRIEDLLSKMNLDEKTCQMATLYGYGRVLEDELPTPEWKNKLWKDGIGNIDEHLNSTTFRSKTNTELSFPYSRHAEAINTMQKWFIEETRLGIPVDFSIEGIRGLAHDRATCFPANIGMGSTWNKDLAYKMGQIIGKEAKALGYTNVYAPILDLARDPRWGRTVESFGEDPFLVGELGVKVASGLQEQNVVSTPKHYALYSVPVGGRDGDARVDPKITEREMHNINLYPFEQVFLRVGALGVMSSYNDYDGIPVSGSHYFLTELLRNKYNFKGYVVSDSDAVRYVWSKHKVAEDYKEGVRQCVEAGLNVRTTFSWPDLFVKPLRELVKEGSLSMDIIDKRVREILRVKFWLGLFDSPFLEKPEIADNTVRQKNHIEISKKASYESLVLLKNENNFLPLDKNKYKSVAVIGENAKETDHSRSRYGPNNVDIVSVLDGIRNKLGKQTQITYAKGCHIQPDNMLELEMYYESPSGEEKKLIEEAVAKVKNSELAIVVLGETSRIVGESKSRTSLNLSGYQEELLRRIHQTGTPTVLVLINGRPITINWADKHISAILEAWFPGEFGGNAVADALFGDYNPGGKLPVTFPKSVGQIPFTFPHKPAAHEGQGNGRSRIVEGLYPFGHGLSYTSFDYSDLKIEMDEDQGSIFVSCKVKNIGKVSGDEVVQLYFSDVVSSVSVYESQLRGFERIHLESGEEKEIQFKLTKDHFSLLNGNMKRVTEPGEFKILVGSSSKDIRLSKSLMMN